ncbi:hypothetical protein [Clostridium septicum]|uniref:hypothetical protein n=1 Tax=Clostridium septicum TaxID=1504 RepID=UPI001FAAD76F|nr:hypothetical protein [Clostridium septicum]
MQGFCGTMPWLADLERQMVKDGVYDEFKRNLKKLEEMNGKSSDLISTLRKMQL